MRKRLLALILCAVMVSAMAATSAVSAKQAEKPSIRHYDVVSEISGLVAGKLTIDLETGHYVFTANYARSGTKDTAKGDAGVPGYIHAYVAGGTHKDFGSLKMTKGGTAHDEGFNTDAANWFKMNPNPIINCIFGVQA